MGRDGQSPEILVAESPASAAVRSESRDIATGAILPRKVFYLVDSLNVGGTEVQAVELAIRLNPERYNVTLGCLRARGSLLERLQGSSVSVREFYPKGGFDSLQGIYQMFRLAMFLRRSRFQIVHTHDLYANVLGIPAAAIARVPVIISSQRDLGHLDLYKSGRRVWLRRLQKLSTVVLTNANAVRQAVLAEDHFAPDKVRVIHNGVDLERFSQRSSDRAWLLPDADQEKWIVLVGNMHGDIKGHEVLIAAAETVVREFPDVRFLLAGDGQQRKEFEEQVARLGLAKNFSFLGRRNDVPRILSCSDIGVLPSQAEGLPNAVLEYLAAGLPTIASRVGGNVEIIHEGKTGLLVPADEPSALAAAVLRLLHDPSLAAELGRNGRSFVSAEFSFKRMIEKTDQMYIELLQSRGVGTNLEPNHGSAGWKRVYRRVRSMGGAEVMDRLRQHATARLDWVRYKVGSDFFPEISTVPQERPQFFFSPEDVPHLCSRLRELFPDIADQIVRRAERICEHRFDLLGYEGVDYGTEIDWHCDRVHGKRAPRKPWFNLKYLDFAEVGDSKVTWELSRHQHLVTLAKAFRLTGDAKFASELFAQWHHWHSENPYPVGINWVSSLEVAFRSLSWLWTYFLIADSPAVPTGFRRSWLRALGVSGRHIESYLSTYFSPNTHLLGEAVALFFIGTLCPEIPASRRWQQLGWKIVQQEATSQVRSDGLHFEQSAYYHVYALDFFLHSAILASVNHIEVPKEFDRTLEKMLDALAALSHGGIVPAFGDDDGGRLFDSTRNQMIHMTDSLATGAVVFGRGDFKDLAGGPREETLWLLGDAGIHEFERVPVKPLPDASAAFRASGLYVMAGDSRKWQLVIDAGPQGAHTAGHGHADALSLTLTAAGRELLSDSGTFEYVGLNSERDRFRGTSAHNTLMVGGVDQAQPRSPFGWDRLPEVQAEGWISGKTFDLFVGSHDGYSRLPNPAIHRRFVLALRSGLILVRDLVLGFGEYPVDIFWHLGHGLTEQSPDFFFGGGTGLRFMTVDGHGWSRRVEEQFHSPVYGVKHAHRTLHFATRAKLPTEFVTLLMPVLTARSSEDSLVKIPAQSAASGSCIGYRYKTSSDEHCFFFGQGAPWKMDSWSTDAEVLYFGRSADASEVSLFCCNATSVEWEGKKIVSARKPVLRCEVIGSTAAVVSSDPVAVAVDSEAWKTVLNSSSVPVKAI
ncbi:MAG TPA: heparinase II/III family protein [Candidatus Sulfotelmatobacter sp.]|nr:heparinase II/III family protein [Candidatus Sulfotelmatobacter sp.]